MTVPVLTMPMLDPGQARARHELPEGLTIAAIVELVLPGLAPTQLARLRIVLADGRGGGWVIPIDRWHQVKPRAGIHVLVRLVPGNDQLKSILLAAVSIAAVALGQFWAPSIVGALGLGTQFTGLVAAGLTAGLTVLGGLLVNALVPTRASGRDAEKPTYAISGWRNSANPGGLVPAVLGRHRIAPTFAAANYTEIVGDDQYVRALFNFGYGPLSITDIRLGETPIGNFTNVEYEIRQGYPSDTPCHLYPQQVLEESLGVELRRDYPRDGNGAPVTGGGAGAEDPVARFSAADINEAAVIIGAPAGMVEYNDQGDPQPLSVDIRIRQRPVGGAWSTVTTLTITGRQSEAFFRIYRWTLPSRGRFEVELTRTTAERTSAQQTDRVVWVALQGFRPEYPINFGKPLALLAMRIKATHQLNGALETVNAIASRIAPDWNGANWVEQETRNPAAAYLFALQGPAATFPEADAGVNLAQLEDWHEYCTAKGLKYDRIHDYEASQWDVLADIAAAGRATPRHDGRKWGVVIDRSGEPIIDHINSANASELTWSRSYFDPPDGFRVQFLDASNDFRSAERVVPWPGGSGDVEVTEQLSLPGKTDPDEIWVEARRRMYELLHRPDRFMATQPGLARRVTRGDRVMGAFDTLEHTTAVQRVRRTHGKLIELTGEVEMIEGEDYACRYRVFDEDDAMTSVLRSVVTKPGRQTVIEVTGAGAMPELDELVHFGIAGSESIALIVTGVEAGENGTAILTAVPEAAIIDTLTDAEVPPAWDGRVGGAIDNDTTAPAAPRVRGVSTRADGFTVLLAPGSGNAVPVATFSVRHRLVGSGSWGPAVNAAAGAGAVTIEGYDPGDDVEWEAQAISPAAVGSAYTATASVEIPTPAPAPGIITSASATPGMGNAALVFATPADSSFEETVIYRGTTNVFANAVEIARLPGLPSSSYSHIDGDATRTNLLSNPGFDSDTAWAKGTGWTIASGKATKGASGGVTTNLSQTVAPAVGKTYRYRLVISGRTLSQVTPGLSGGTTVNGPALTANGTFLGSVVAVAGNNAWRFAGAASFDGSLDDVVLFEQTATCVAQGTHYYFFTAANADGAESAPLAIGPIDII